MNYVNRVKALIESNKNSKEIIQQLALNERVGVGDFVTTLNTYVSKGVDRLSDIPRTEFIDMEILSIPQHETGEVIYTNPQGEVHIDWGPEFGVTVDTMDSEFYQKIEQT